MTGCIFEVREFCVHDGPGIRTTVFFKGCPLRCLWCQNPEGLAFAPELLLNGRACLECGCCRTVCLSPGHCTACGRCAEVCPAGKRVIAGRRVEVETLARQLLRDREFLASSGGGVTFSGGEPLAQPEFLFALCDALPGVHRVLETSGFASGEVYEEMLRHVDLVFQDLKCADPERQRRLTGQSNAPILANLERLKRSGTPFVIRIPVIPGINDDEADLDRLAALLTDARDRTEVQLLPWNPAAPAKYPQTGRVFPMTPPTSAADPASLCRIFTARQLRCRSL